MSKYKNPIAVSHNLCSEKGCRFTGRVPCGFFLLIKSFTLQAANPLAPAPANHLKPFTWITCRKQKHSPGFWQKVLAYCATKPLEPNQTWSDTTETFFSPVEDRRDNMCSIVQRLFFFSPCWSGCCDWLCSFYNSHPNFPHRSPFMSTISIEKIFVTMAIELAWQFPATSRKQLPVLAAQWDWYHRKETQNYMVNLEQSGPLWRTI